MFLVLCCMCTVAVRIFCSKCDASIVYWPFAHLHLKAFCYLCTVNVIFQYGKGEQKYITKKVIKFPNQSTLLTLLRPTTLLNRQQPMFPGEPTNTRFNWKRLILVFTKDTNHTVYGLVFVRNCKVRIPVTPC